MSALKPTGFSVTKVVITFLAWNAFVFSLFYAISNFNLIKQKIPRLAYVFFVALVIWNITGIVKGFLDGSMAATTLFGNAYTSLAMLVPLAMPFGLDKSHLRIVNRYFLILIAVGIISGLITLFTSLISETEGPILGLPSLFVYLVAFLITTLRFQSSKHQTIILAAGAIQFIFAGLVGGSRATIARILLLFFSLMLLGMYRKFNMRWIPAVAMLAFLIPFYFVYTGTVTGQSFLTGARSYVLDTVGTTQSTRFLEKADTRTFLYREIFDDLIHNDHFLTGKGSGGTYFSPYFFFSGHDIDQRFTSEVGLLALLLKGGVIGVFLNLCLFLTAMFLAFYRANNYYVSAIGFMLLVHVLILFVENLVSYNLYNYAIWFFVGICLSSEIRSLNDDQIKELLIGEANA